eukprot:TRINITY_DN853_c0_g3_i2.p1 TRINITY_DN853_c0_g3~~TRINITY_DN853_c0_g3_i2.p1  ORF type:complete len:1250 (+),score=437.44 TRINITY_DN853_c0_g3_i2:68-3751(+)
MVLLNKIVRLLNVWSGKYFKNEDGTELEWNRKEKLRIICSDVLLPAISLLHCNPPLMQEIWNLVKRFTFKERYEMYGFWRKSQKEGHPLQKLEANKSSKRMGSLLKTMATKTGKKGNIARKLAMIIQPNIIVTMEKFLEQLEFFPAAQQLVQQFKYMPQLSIDVIMYLLLHRFAKRGRNATKLFDDSQLRYADWYIRVSGFLVDLLKHTENMSMQPIMEFILQKTVISEFKELHLLQQLLKEIGKVWDSSEDDSERLRSRAGGPCLDKYLPLPFEDKVPSHSLKRFVNAIRPIYVQLLISIAQHVQTNMHQSPERPALTSFSCDLCLTVFKMFRDFCSRHFYEYPIDIPTITSLNQDFKLMPSLCMEIVRPAIAKVQRQVDIKDGDHATTYSQDIMNRWSMTSESLIEEVSQLVPGITETAQQRGIPASLYVLLWSIDLGDLVDSKSSYKNLIKQYHEDISKGDDKKRLERRINKLKNEMKEQKIINEKRSKMIIAAITPLTGHSFTRYGTIARCLVERSMLDPAGGVFSYMVLNMLREYPQRAVSVSTIINKIAHFTNMIQLCSSQEARNLGILIREVFWGLHSWSKTKELYNKHCTEQIGFFGPEDHPESYSRYKSMYARLQVIVFQVLGTALNSKKDAVIQKNALLFVFKMADQFPFNVKTRSETHIDLFKSGLAAVHSVKPLLTLVTSLMKKLSDLYPKRFSAEEVEAQTRSSMAGSAMPPIKEDSSSSSSGRTQESVYDLMGPSSSSSRYDRRRDDDRERSSMSRARSERRSSADRDRDPNTSSSSQSRASMKRSSSGANGNVTTSAEEAPMKRARQASPPPALPMKRSIVEPLRPVRPRNIPLGSKTPNSENRSKSTATATVTSSSSSSSSGDNKTSTNVNNDKKKKASIETKEKQQPSKKPAPVVTSSSSNKTENKNNNNNNKTKKQLADEDYERRKKARQAKFGTGAETDGGVDTATTTDSVATSSSSSDKKSKIVRKTISKDNVKTTTATTKEKDQVEQSKPKTKVKKTVTKSSDKSTTSNKASQPQKSIQKPSTQKSSTQKTNQKPSTQKSESEDSTSLRKTRSPSRRVNTGKDKSTSEKSSTTSKDEKKKELPKKLPLSKARASPEELKKQIESTKQETVSSNSSSGKTRKRRRVPSSSSSSSSNAENRNSSPPRKTAKLETKRDNKEKDIEEKIRRQKSARQSSSSRGQQQDEPRRSRSPAPPRSYRGSTGSRRH